MKKTFLEEYVEMAGVTITDEMRDRIRKVNEACSRERMEDEEFGELDDLEEIPRGDKTIEELDDEGELADRMADAGMERGSSSDLQTLTFVDSSVAELVSELLQRWNIDAKVSGANSENGQYRVTFPGTPDTKEDVVNAMMKAIRQQREPVMENTNFFGTKDGIKNRVLAAIESGSLDPVKVVKDMMIYVDELELTELSEINNYFGE